MTNYLSFNGETEIDSKTSRLLKGYFSTFLVLTYKKHEWSYVTIMYGWALFCGRQQVRYAGM